MYAKVRASVVMMTSGLQLQTTAISIQLGFDVPLSSSLQVEHWALLLLVQFSFAWGTIGFPIVPPTSLGQ